MFKLKRMLLYKINTFYDYFYGDVGRESLRRTLKRVEKVAGL